MQTEVILAAISGFVTLGVALVNTLRNGNKKEEDKKSEEAGSAKPSADKTVDKAEDLRRKRKASFDNREELYNKLTLVIGRYLVYHIKGGEQQIAELIEKCVIADEQYNDVLDEVTNHLLDGIK